VRNKQTEVRWSPVLDRNTKSPGYMRANRIAGPVMICQTTIKGLSVGGLDA
jgi:hypothetical protein